MNLRGARVTPIHRGSVLLSKQEDLCSTSYYGNERWTVNLVPARITRRAGASLSFFFEIFEIFENFEISTKNINFWNVRSEYNFSMELSFLYLLALS